MFKTITRRHNIFTRKKLVDKVSKFMCTLVDKRNYTPHIRLLQQALKLCLIFKKVHKATKIKQSYWLKPVYWFEYQISNIFKTWFWKKIFKLRKSSLFGKVIQNNRKQRHIRVVTNEKSRKNHTWKFKNIWHDKL